MKYLFLIILTLFLKPDTAIASHGMGGEIVYECLSANNYKIKLTLYRDCSGINLSSVQTIRISNSCGFSILDTMNLNQVGNAQFYSSVCSSDPTTCMGGTQFGMARYTYEGIITLPGVCNDWMFSHTVVNRNFNSTTVGSSIDSLFVYSLINNQNSICNNSPTFSNSAVGIFYTGYDACYDNGDFDIDGDSLYYELATPRTGPTLADTVLYLGGYSASVPISSSIPVTFDNANGRLCFNPSQQEVSVFAIIISEFRNGLLIGKTERDIQLRARQDPNPNTYPVLSGINGTNVFNINACSGNAVVFSIYGIDQDTSENLLMDWDDGISNGTWVTYSSTSSNSDSAHFSWIPSLTDVSTIPHCFTVYVYDNHCPYVGIDSQMFCITVLPPTDPFCINPGINEELNTAIFQVHPNPVQDKLEIITLFLRDKKSYFQIFNSTGQKIFSKQFYSETGIVLDVSEWQSGVYECIMISGADKYSKRIIRQ